MTEQGHSRSEEKSLQSVMGRGLSVDDELNAVREAARHELEAIRSLVEQHIEHLKQQQKDNELDDVIGQLEAVLTSIDGSLSVAATGSLGALMAVSQNISSIASVAAGATSFAQTQAHYQTAVLFAEMTDTHVRQLHAENDRAATQFQHYEDRSASRIEALAAQHGVDVSLWRASRDDLIKQREEALKRGDRLGYFKSDALLATNNVHGLMQAGGSQGDIDRAKEEARAAEKRYLDEVRLQALKEAQAAGMDQQQTVNHIAQSTTDAHAQLQAEKVALAKRNGLQGQTVAEAARANAENRTDDKQTENKRTAIKSDTQAQTVKTSESWASTDAKLAKNDRKRAASDDPFAAVAEEAKAAAPEKDLKLAQADHDAKSPNGPNQGAGNGKQIG